MNLLRTYMFTSFTHTAVDLNFSRSPLQDSLMEISKKCPSILCKYFVTKPENENCKTGAGSTQPICRFNSGITVLSFYNKWDTAIYMCLHWLAALRWNVKWGWVELKWNPNKLNPLHQKPWFTGLPKRYSSATFIWNWTELLFNQ